MHMNPLRASNRLVQVAIAAAFMASAGFALSAEPPSSASPAPSKQMREQMASVHERMAACMRSDKSMAECRTEMMQNCQTMMGDNGCQMMGMSMGMGMGMHGGMMKQPPAPPPDSK
jgi:hypothetical protein